MYVYLRLGTKLKCIKDVTLRDGYLPLVGEVGKDLQLEPAIWFKSLIIDSILIDSDQRIVRWGKLKVSESDVQSHISGDHLDLSLPLEPDNIVNMLDLQTSVFSDADDFDSNPDELFNSTRLLVQNILSGKIDEEQLKKEVLRLLHCIVLPAILFTEEDIPALHNALKVIEKILKGIDADIISRDKGILLTENSLKTQRGTILKNETFTSEKYLQNCDPKFLELFLKHVEKDVENKGHHMQELQEIINRMKKNENLTHEEKETLSDLRGNRDQTHGELINLQEVRECLKNVVVRPRRQSGHKQQNSSKNLQPNVFHEIYMEIVSRLTNEKEEIHRLCLRKVKISSVREAIFLALDELKSDGRSVGMQVAADGMGMVTDVGQGKPEEWLTIEEKITALLEDTSSTPSKYHNKFCRRISEKIRGRLEDEKLFLQLCEENDTRERSTSDGYVDISTPSTDGSGEFTRHSAVLTEGLSRHTHPFLSLVETIKHDIIDHTQSMVEMLIHHLLKVPQENGKVDVNMYNKVCTAYQLHMHYRVMKSIEELYEAAYNDISSNMFQK